MGATSCHVVFSGGHMRGREGGSRPVTRVDKAVVRVHDRGGQGLRTGAMTGMDRAYGQGLDRG